LASDSSEPGRLGHWFRDLQQPLRRFLARHQAGSIADIDDIAQEVFLRLLRYDRAELVDHPKAYLFKIATNVSAEWSMRSSRRWPHDSAWLTELVDSFSPDIELEQEGRDESVRSAVETLPGRAREILRLHFGEGLTYPQIAVVLSVTRKIVKRDLARSYAALRSMLDADRMGTSEPRRTGTPT
jgi:RNA polymerase sigma-70 factor (ECF subfamily)